VVPGEVSAWCRREYRKFGQEILPLENDRICSVLLMAAPEILLVGDSLHDDVEAAMRAGLSAVLIDRRDRHETIKHVQRISSLQDVLPLIEK